jgi:hypothetical protein
MRGGALFPWLFHAASKSVAFPTPTDQRADAFVSITVIVAVIPTCERVQRKE